MSTSEAHYLHRREGLTLALRPGVRAPVAIDWTAQGALVVATARGDGLSVHPSLGTRILWEKGPPVFAIGRVAVDLVVVDAAGWRRIDSVGALVAQGDHKFTGRVDLHVDGEHFMLVGDTATDRRVEVFEENKRVFRVLMPHDATAWPRVGGLGLARSVRAGVEVIDPSAGERFSSRRSGGRRLVSTRQMLVGLGEADVACFLEHGQPTCTLAVAGATCATRVDAHHLLIGTADGGLALADLRPEASPIVAVHAHDDAVHSVAASTQGEWAASAGAVVFMWSVDRS